MIVERTLMQQSGVMKVDVSHQQGTLVLHTKEDVMYTVQDLNRLLASDTYTVGEARADGGARGVDWKRVGGALVLAIALYVLLDRVGLLRLSPSASQPSSLLGVFVIGLIASVSSCTAVVGGLIVAVSGAVRAQQERLTRIQRLRPHLLFHIGRVGGFFVLGALVGWIGSALQLSPAVNGIFLVAVAVLMMLIGANLLNLFPSRLHMPKWLAHRVHDLAVSEDPKAPLALGAATFFLPCGFTQSMQLLALSLQDPIASGLIMAAFALGTTPVLLGLGSLTAYASGTALRRVVAVAGLVVLVLGASNVLNGLTLLGINPDAWTQSQTAGAPAAVVGTRQEIQMEVTSYGTYEPAVLTVQAGVPVDWRITGADFMGCADTLLLPAFDVRSSLRSGPNLVQFTPTKPGKFTFSCSMGMVRGTLIVTR